MKALPLTLFLLLSLPLNATLTKIVPHLAINSDWRSMLMLRNDISLASAISMEFRNSAGNLTSCVFYDSDGNQFQGSSYSLTLQGYEIYTLEFDQILSEDLNISVFLFSSDSSNYGIEAIYNFYNGSIKRSSVGVPYLGANYNFILDLDHRNDAYSGGKLFRGLALTNSSSQPCNCRVELFTDGAAGENLEGGYPLGSFQISKYAKWLWVSSSGFNSYSLDALMPKKIGYMTFSCDRPVAVLGLAFESGTPVTASIPISFFTTGKNKDGKEIRIPASGLK